MTNETDNGAAHSWRGLFGETLIILLATAFTYLMAAGFERGSCQAFAIPEEFASVSLLTLGPTLALMGGYFLLNILFYRAYTWLLSRYLKDYKAYAWVAPVVIAVLLGVTAYRTPAPEPPLAQIGLLMLVVGLTGWGLVRVVRARRRYDWAVVALAIFLLMNLLGLSIHAGIAWALSSSRFAVLQGDPELAVVHRCGDTLVCMPFDRQSKTVTGQFRLLPIGSDTNAVFTSEPVGPLRLTTGPSTTK